MLINAVYFKGDWLKKFSPRQTEATPFTVKPGTTIKVPMLHKKSEFDYVETPEVQVLEHLYLGEELLMLLLLPSKDSDSFTAGLTSKKLQELQKQLYKHNVYIMLPNFKLETRYYLENSQYLPAMGMLEPFKNTADFSGITGNKELRIGHVIHQAMIDVNEEGSEAAAATAVVMTKACMRPVAKTAVFRADRPSMFIIIHKSTNSLLFMGRVCNPTGH